MSKRERIAEAYKMLAKVGYRPAAPSDGLGNITVPLEELDLDREAQQYAKGFIEQEDTGQYFAGSTHYSYNRAAVLALEAFKLMNGGVMWRDSPEGAELVPKLLRMAAEEYEQAVRDEMSRDV